ncbi:MAG: D-alanine--D-alanine ligase [Phycisphaerales bacterium]|jgi:D-alanine-D-alanine ligase|nr:D-alanine--D-alanine ligase [Phycisphaerales bacterium]
MSKLSVMILMGGPDAERNVSIESGNAVVEALKQSERFEVSSQIIDTPTINDILKINSDIVFPVLHGPFGEGGPLQQLLEKAGLPYVGSCSKTSANAMDKVTTKEIAKEAVIQTPEWCTVSNCQECTIQTPLVIKPINDGSSLDLKICHTEDQFIHAKTGLLQIHKTMLVESYVKGREVTVGIINGKPLPIIEIKPPADLQSYDYEAKYERNDTQYLFDSDLPNNSCVQDAIKLYKLMGIRDLARADFIVNQCGSWFLEINTMPGFTSHSLVPMAARHIGISMVDLCSELVENVACRLVK